LSRTLIQTLVVVEVEEREERESESDYCCCATQVARILQGCDTRENRESAEDLGGYLFVLASGTKSSR